LDERIRVPKSDRVAFMERVARTVFSQATSESAPPSSPPSSSTSSSSSSSSSSSTSTPPPDPQPHPQPRPHQLPEKLRQRQQDIKGARERAVKASELLKNRHIGKAMRTLLQGERLAMVDELLPKIDSLFVTSDAWQGLPNPPAPTAITINTEIVTQAIKALAKGQSASVSGAAPDHFLPLLDDKVCIDSLVVILRAIAHGHLSDDVRSILLRGRLVILAKPNGGLRPITVPEPLLMLAEYICLLPCNQYLDSVLQPIQLGVGAPSGVDTAAHLMQQVIDSGSREHGTAVVLIDITNAYGTISRRAMLEALYKHQRLKPLWQIARWSLGAPAVRYLRMDDGSIRFFWQQEGGAQGSVIMPALFAVALQPVLKEAIQDLNVTTVAILDDIASGGGITDVIEFYDRVKERIERELGSKVNPSKTVLVLGYDGPPTDETVALCAARGIKIEPKGAKYVGAFIGRDEEARRQFVVEQAEKHTSMFSALLNPHLSAQMATTLLRFCAMPVMNHLLRTMAPAYTRDGARTFDRMAVKTLATILHQPELSRIFEQLLDDQNAEVDTVQSNALIQLLLPARLGGLGIVPTERVAEAAFLGSYASCASKCVHFYGHDAAGVPIVSARAGQLNQGLDAAAAAAADGEDDGNKAKKRRHGKPPGKPQPYRPPGVAAGELAHIEASIGSLLSLIPALGQMPAGDDNAQPVLPGRAIDLLARGIADSSFRQQLQRSITVVVNAELSKMLFNRTLNVPERARLLSVMGPGAHRAWTVIPTTPALTLQDLHFRLATAYRLGLPVVLPPNKGKDLCVRNCGYLITDNAHAHGCPPLRAQAGIAAHDAMNALLINQFVRAGEQVAKEVMLPSGKRMDAMVFMPHRVLNIDVSITCPSTKSVMETASQVPMHAALVREAYKCTKYDDEVDQEGGDFVPFVLESYGAMTRTVEHMAELIQEAAINNCVPQPPSKKDLLNEIAVQLQRGVSLCLIKAMAAARQSVGPWVN
jgi:hypothetical protein